MPLLDTLLTAIAPHSCLVCGREGKLICLWCKEDAFIGLPSRCYRCRRLTTEFSLCDRCKKQTPLRHVWVRTYYDDTAKKLLRAYKYERVRAATMPIAEAMDEILPFMHKNTLIIPVPTATSRIRQRGYDHAALLARELAKKRQLAWLRTVTHLSQSRQVGASRTKRQTQLKNDLVVTKPSLVKSMDILIVDDVVTTGSTLETMALILKQAGAKSVNAVVFAQKQ